jgi:hypothetical protein
MEEPMDENLIENLWNYDAVVNDPRNPVSPDPRPWHPTEFHVRLNDLPLNDEAAKQLEMEIRALIEMELKNDGEEPIADDSIQISVLGLGLRPDRAAHLSQALAALVRDQLAKTQASESKSKPDKED